MGWQLKQIQVYWCLNIYGVEANPSFKDASIHTNLIDNRAKKIECGWIWDLMKCKFTVRETVWRSQKIVSPSGRFLDLFWRQLFMVKAWQFNTYHLNHLHIFPWTTGLFCRYPMFGHTHTLIFCCTVNGLAQESAGKRCFHHQLNRGLRFQFSGTPIQSKLPRRPKQNRRRSDVGCASEESPRWQVSTKGTRMMLEDCKNSENCMDCTAFPRDIPWIVLH